MRKILSETRKNFLKRLKNFRFKRKIPIFAPILNLALTNKNCLTQRRQG